MGISDGYFPRGESVLRQVHEERIVGLLYGQRGLMMGGLDPVVSSGTFQAGQGFSAPFDRLTRTAKIFEATFFGSREQADEAIARVNRLHTRVRGELSRSAGPYPAGTRFDALDPDQMLWTLGCIVDSAQRVYELMVRRLDDGEREGLWSDYVRWGGLWGLPAANMPATYREFRDWFNGRIEGDELFLTEESREIGRIVALELPGPLPVRSGLQVANLLVIGSLPARVRELYELRWTPFHIASFVAAVRGHRVAHPLVPKPLRRGSCGINFELIRRFEGRYGRGQQQRSAAAAAARH